MLKRIGDIIHPWPTPVLFFIHSVSVSLIQWWWSSRCCKKYLLAEITCICWVGGSRGGRSPLILEDAEGPKSPISYQVIHFFLVIGVFKYATRKKDRNGPPDRHVRSSGKHQTSDLRCRVCQKHQQARYSFLEEMVQKIINVENQVHIMIN